MSQPDKHGEPASFISFQIGLVITLCYGAFLSELTAGVENSIILGGFYLVALGFQHWLFGTSYFDPSRKKQLDSGTLDEVIFEGKPIETQARVEREKKTLDRILSVSVQLRLRLASLTLIGAYAFLVMNHIFVMHFSLILHLIASLLLIPAMAPNHFVLPLVFNVLAVTYGYVTMEQQEVVLFSLYCFLVIYTLLFFGHLMRETGRTNEARVALRALAARTLRTALQIAFFFVLLLVAVDYAVPRSSHADAAVKKQLKEKVEELQKFLSKWSPKNQEKPKTEGSGVPQPDGSQAAPSAVPSPPPSAQAAASPSPVPSMEPSATPQGLPSALPSPNPTFTPEQLEQIAKIAAQLSQEARKQGKDPRDSKPQGTPGELKPENLQATSDLLKRMAQQLSASPGQHKAKPKRGESGDPFPFPNPGPSPMPEWQKDALIRTMKAMAKALEERAKNPPRPAGGSSSASASGSTSNTSGNSSATSGSSSATSGASSAASGAASGASGGAGGGGAAAGGGGGGAGSAGDAKKKSKRPETLWDWIERLLDPFLILLGLLLAYYFRRKLRRKADPKQLTRLQFAHEQRAEILKRLQELARGKLSPREEIIARYELYLRIMEMARTPRESHIPPLEYYRRIRYIHPKLESESRKLSEGFCDTFYGEYEVQPGLLRDVRSAVKHVFEHFA